MTEQKLFDFLEATELKIQANEISFFNFWNKFISSNITVNNFFKIENYISIFGGFKLSVTDFCELDSFLQGYFLKHGKKENDSIWLRGYDYYECDPQMHKKSEQVNEHTLWGTFSKHWDDYNQLTSISDQKFSNLNLINWIGMLSFLECLFNDLTTLHWFILSNEDGIKLISSSHKILSIVEDAINEIGDLIAELLLFSLKEPGKVFRAKINSVISNEIIGEFVNDTQRISYFKPGCVRAIREGDSIPLIFSAYITKLLPFCENEQSKPILLMSNAFGALNLGVVFKYLLQGYISVDHINIHYSQHRADISDIGKESKAVVAYGLSNENKNYHESCLIVVDDCIFTGKSFGEIKNSYQPNKSVFLLPLTIDIQSLKYYKRETRNTHETLKTTNKVVLWANELGNRLPAFQGFWDWNNFSKIDFKQKDPEFNRVLKGGDLLLKTLWVRYRKEIAN